MDFVKLLVTLIVAIYAKRGLPVDETQQQRLEGVAEDMWVVTEGSDGPFHGEAAHATNSLVLAAIAAHESGFWGKVQDCSACYRGSVWCDKGRSISLYQLHEGSRSWGKFSRQEICEDNKVATQLAWNIVTRNKKANTSLAVFKGYARGGRRGASTEMDFIFQEMLKKSNIRLSYGEHMTASFIPEKKKAALAINIDRNFGIGQDIVTLVNAPQNSSYSYLACTAEPTTSPFLVLD